MKDVAILNEDEMYTYDVKKMGTPFMRYITDSLGVLEKSAQRLKIDPATIEIISEVLNYGALASKGIQYIPNLDALPQDIKDGIKSNKYVLGESKTVNGDLRAVLVDTTKKGNPRVRDITLKEVRVDPERMELTRNVLTQIQMKQISEKLDAIYDLQLYQVKRDRDRDLREPFFKSRDNIRNAQLTTKEVDRIQYLNAATDSLSDVIQSSYQDMRTSSELLAEKVMKPLFQKNKTVHRYIANICEDICMVNLSLGFKLQVYDCLEKREEAVGILREYIHNMKEFATVPIGTHGESAIGLLQDNFPYRKNTYNLWYDFYQKVSRFDVNTLNDRSSACVLICMEE